MSLSGGEHQHQRDEARRLHPLEDAHAIGTPEGLERREAPQKEEGRGAGTTSSIRSRPMRSVRLAWLTNRSASSTKPSQSCAAVRRIAREQRLGERANDAPMPGPKRRSCEVHAASFKSIASAVPTRLSDEAQCAGCAWCSPSSTQTVSRSSPSTAVRPLPAFDSTQASGRGESTRRTAEDARRRRVRDEPTRRPCPRAQAGDPRATSSRPISDWIICESFSATRKASPMSDGCPRGEPLTPARDVGLAAKEEVSQVEVRLSEEARRRLVLEGTSGSSVPRAKSLSTLPARSIEAGTGSTWTRTPAASQACASSERQAS